jgi:16S rRNA (guanine(527)-N(7))-methyltransferase RsmG
MQIFPPQICQVLLVVGIALSTTQLGELTHYLTLLLRWRLHLNLTGLRDAERMLDVLIVESLDFLQGDFFLPGMRVLDLGTGVGVPGIPLAVGRPYVHVTLLDRSEKKSTFLLRVVASLPLENCQPCCSTAEDLAHRLRPQEYFDVVVSRGVGRGPTSCASPHRFSNQEVDSSYASPCVPLSCRKQSCYGLRRRGEASRRCPYPGEHHLLGLFCLSCRALRINDLQRKVSKLLDKSKVLTIARYNSGSNRATAEGNQDIIEQA